MKPSETVSGSDERQLFIQALEKPAGEARAAFLDGACRGNSDLRRRLEALLKQFEALGTFLEQPAASGPDAPFVRPPADSLRETVVVDDSSQQAGNQIGRYKLLQQIGEGGCGVVYMAEQQEPVRRRVALKVIRLGMDTKNVIARFEAERQALALMDHPNIAKVLDAGATETGRPYFVMELVRGIKITDYCDQNNLPTRHRLELFMQICRAIQHAHQKGIIHRDIKPSNVLVTLHDGIPLPKVIDFGIAKATTDQRLTDKTLFTQFEQFIGTPAYMSPEQAEMGGLDIDTRSDIYSLGVLLYELLTGKTPFDAKDLLALGLDEMRRTIREKEPIRPSTRLGTLLEGELTTTAKRRACEALALIHTLRGDLDWIVMKALEKDRTRRYETANSLAVDIQRHLSQEPVIARPPSRLYHFQKLVRRNKLAVAAISSVAAALVFGIVVSGWQAIRARANERKALIAQQNEAKQRQVAEEQRKVAVEQARELSRLNYVGDMSKAFHAIKEGDLSLAKNLVQKYLNPDPLNSGPGQEDLRGFEWRYLWRLCQPSDHETLVREPSDLNCAVFSPDGKTLATGGWERTVTFFDLASKRVLRNLSGFDGKIDTRALTFSRDGRLFAGKGGHVIRVWETDTWRELFQWTNGFPNDNINDSVVISPDNATLAARIQDGVGFWDLKTGQPITTVQGPNTLGTVMAYSPDGTLLVMSDKNQLQLRDAKSLTVFTNLVYRQSLGTPYTFRVLSVAFSKHFIAVGYRYGEVKLWDLKTWAELASWKAHSSFVVGLDFSPDGTRLASGGSDRQIRLWSVATILSTGTNATTVIPDFTLQGHTHLINSAIFAPGGHTLASASADGTAKLWSLPPAERPVPLFETKPADDKGDWWFLDDGKRVVYEDHQNQFYLAEIAGAIPALRLKAPATVAGETVSPDGRTLALRGNSGSVELWDLETGELKETFRDGGPASGIAFAQHGRFLISSHYAGQIRIRDMSTHRSEVITTNVMQHGDWSIPFAVSQDGCSVAARSTPTQIGLWNIPSGQALEPLHIPLGLFETFAVSHDGRWLAFSSWPDTSVQLWDVVSRQPKQMPVSEQTAILSMAFAPDDKTLVLVTYDATVSFWNLATLQEIVREQNFAGNFGSALFSPNGDYLALPLELRHAPSLAEIEAKERARPTIISAAPDKVRK